MELKDIRVKLATDLFELGATSDMLHVAIMACNEVYALAMGHAAEIAKGRRETAREMQDNSRRLMEESVLKL